MKTKIFTGEYFERGATRKITTEDPGQPGRTISKLAKFDVVTDLVIDRVSGYGPSEKTGEMQITLSGQYGKGCKTCRVTAFAQDVDTISKALKGNVEKSETLPYMLKNEIVVKAIGTPMKGYGLNLTELYLKGENGFTTIIAPPVAAEGTQAEGNLVDAFL